MKKWIIVIVLLLIAAIVGYNYIYQSHREIEKETAKFEISSEDLASSFSANSKDAEAKYLNATVLVSGNISEIANNNITLDEKVFCQFKNDIETELTEKSSIKIKGRVIGYDDLLEQVKLDQCIIK